MGTAAQRRAVTERTGTTTTFRASMPNAISRRRSLWVLTSHSGLLGKLGRTSIRYNFEIFLDEEPDEVAANGSVTVVVLRDGKPSEIPPQLRSAFAD